MIVGKDIKPVFMIGYGRSGANFIGRVLSEHNGIYATIEEKAWFKSFSEVAFARVCVKKNRRDEFFEDCFAF